MSGGGSLLICDNNGAANTSEETDGEKRRSKHFFHGTNSFLWANALFPIALLGYTHSISKKFY